MSEHAPTPCKECDHLRDIIQKGRQYWEGYADAECELTGEPAKRGPSILRTVNAHEELLEAAKNAVEIFKTDGRFNGEVSAVARLKQAISKAERK